ncbi:hypothetical protein [Mycolicibacterium sphagni]|nr:hypothetical protein [Mycolicibacterium sphagni]
MSPEVERLSQWLADRRSLSDIAAVHNAADSSRLPGETILKPTD